MSDRSRMARRVVAGGIAALLVLVVAEGWMPRVTQASGGEDRPVVDAHEQARAHGFDLDAAVERVGHQIAPAPGRAGVLSTGNSRYAAEFDDGGFTYRPAGATTPFRLSLTGVSRSGADPAVEPGAWTSRDNVARRPVAPGVDERVTARDGEVEWDVVLTSRPEGSGPLTVRGRLDGIAGAPVRVDRGSGPAWRLGLQGGSSVDVDEVVVKDAGGRTVYRGLPDTTAGSVELRIPASVVDRAHYPLTIDPTVTNPTNVTPQGHGNGPVVAYGAGVYLVVYENLGPVGNIDVRARFLDANGVLDNDILGVGASTKNETLPDVAWNGSNFLVVWKLAYSSTDTDIQARTVDNVHTMGPVTNVSSRTTAEDQPSVGSCNSTFFIAWQDNRNGSLDIYGTRWDGGVDDANGIPVATGGSTDSLPDVAGNADDFLIAYQHDFSASDSDVYGRRVDRAGLVLGTAPIEIAVALDKQRLPSVASDGTQWLVAFEDETTLGTGAYDISAARVSKAGASQGVFPLVTASADQLQPSVAFRGVFLVVWWDKRSGPDFSDVYGARVQGDGTVKDPDGFPIANTAALQDFPAVSAGGTNDANWGVVDELGSQPQIEWRGVSK